MTVMLALKTNAEQTGVRGSQRFDRQGGVGW